MKTICVPVSLEAMDRLNIDKANPEDLLEIKLERIEFEEIWKSGFFLELNSRLGLMIDEYEDEHIPWDSIDVAIEIFEHFHRQNLIKTQKFFMIKTLLCFAKKNQTEVYFFF